MMEGKEKDYREKRKIIRRGREKDKIRKKEGERRKGAWEERLVDEQKVLEGRKGEEERRGGVKDKKS